MPLAVNAGAVAYPWAFVSTVQVALPKHPSGNERNVPEAPLPGAVKVTARFGTGFAPLSTRTCKSVVYCVLMNALCGVPAVAVIT